MGRITREQRFILYALGTTHKQLNAFFAGKPLAVHISKAAFIDLARGAGLVKKKERALYKNMEDLQKRKLISYTKKSLVLTPRGQRLYEAVNNELNPYITVTSILNNQSVMRFAKKVRPVLKT